MRIETARRMPAGPVERGPAAWRARVRGMPVVAVLFVVSLMVPIIINLGPLRLLPHRLFLLVLFVPLLAKLLAGRAGRVGAIDYLVAGSALWAAIAMLVSQPGAETMEPVGIHLVEFLGAYLVGRMAIRSSETFIRFVRVFFWMVVILLPFAALESILHRAILLELIPQSHAVIHGGGPRFGLRRAQTLFAHPILYGVFVSTALGLCWYALRPLAGFATRLSIAATVFLATFFSLSSGAIVAFVVQSGIILWDLLFRRIPRHWKIFGWCVAFGYVAVDLLSNRTPFHLLVDYATFSSTTGYYRIVIWRWGMENVWANPLFGLGLNLAQWERAEWMHGSIDNFWLLIAMQYGIPAFLMLALGIFLMVRRITRASLPNPVDRACRTGYLISLAGLIIAGGTVHYWHAAAAFFMFLIGAGMWMTTGDAAARPAGTARDTKRKGPRPTLGAARAPGPRDPSAPSGTSERPRTYLK